MAFLAEKLASSYRKFSPLVGVAGRDVVESLTPGMRGQRKQTEISVDSLVRKVDQYGSSGKLSPEKATANLDRLTYGSNLPEYDQNRKDAVLADESVKGLSRGQPETDLNLSPSFADTASMRWKNVLGKYDNPAETPGLKKGRITLDTYKGASDKTAVSDTMVHENMHAFDLQGNRSAFRNNAVPPTNTPEGARDFMDRLASASAKNTRFGGWLRGFLKAMTGGSGLASHVDPHQVSELYAELMTSVSPQDLLKEAPSLYEVSPWK